jgi:transposase-like protein
MARRCRFTPEVKAKVVLEIISGAKDVGEVCRQYHVSPNRVDEWTSAFQRRHPKSFRLINHV